MTYETHTLSLIVLPKGEPIYSEKATIIQIEDNLEGPFIRLLQPNTGSDGIEFDSSEWPEIADAVATMIIQCNILESGAAKE